MMDSCIPEIPVQDYAQRLVKNEGERRTPFSGTLDLTFRCNNRCVHCYVNKPVEDHEEKKKELTRAEICRILDHLADEGCLWLLMTGGEPFVREDFRDIYRYAKRKGFITTLFTNGTLITPSLAKFLQELPPHSIEITLYGITQNTYEGITRLPGSYKRCMNGINLLLERNLPLKLKTIVIKPNKQEFASIKAFVENLGLEFRFDAMINERLDGREKVAKLRIPPREVVKLDLTDPRRRPEYVRLYKEAPEARPDPEALFSCGAGINSFHIDPYGRLLVCNMAREPGYDLRRGSFQEGWHHFLPQIRAQKWRKKHKCKDCDLIPICDQCPGWSQLEHGDQEIPVEYLCQVAHLRAKALGIGNCGLGK
jgi:radical SAM protein with 4Fe4S-binding SPASM domain